MRWLRSKKAETPRPAGRIDPERYTGKPLLRLLELYVIWAVGKLSDEDASRLQGMAPKLTEMYGGDGTWQSALATTMQMPENLPELIREMWAKNQTIASVNKVDLQPQQFAEMFVDSNLT